MSKIATIGAGRMGRGIAHTFACAGHDIALIDFKARPEEEAIVLLQTGKQDIRQNLEFLAQAGVVESDAIETILQRIHLVPMSSATEALADAELIFEGVPETLEAKQDALTRLSNMVSGDAIVASTTSTIMVDELAKFVVHPQQFLNAHWLNPAYLIPLVEVSPGAKTDEDVIDRLFSCLKDIGKTPVRCKASPGYIIPRIQSVAMNEAARMVEEGVATAEDIDTAIQAGFGIRYATMGLVEFIDWGGVDILYYASNYLSQALASERYATPKIVEDMMEQGYMGLSTGRGFYDFSDKDPEEFRREKLVTFVSLLKHLDMLPKIS